MEFLQHFFMWLSLIAIGFVMLSIAGIVLAFMAWVLGTTLASIIISVAIVASFFAALSSQNS